MGDISIRNILSEIFWLELFLRRYFDPEPVNSMKINVLKIVSTEVGVPVGMYVYLHRNEGENECF